MRSKGETFCLCEKIKENTEKAEGVLAAWPWFESRENMVPPLSPGLMAAALLTPHQGQGRLLGTWWDLLWCDREMGKKMSHLL